MSTDVTKADGRSPDVSPWLTADELRSMMRQFSTALADRMVPLDLGRFRCDGQYQPGRAMTDTTTIEPALSAEEWAKVRDGTFPSGDMRILPDNELDAGIAYLNDRLPDSDPRKITRAKLDELASIIESARERTLDPEPASRAFLDALASYLPPEGV